VLRRNTNFGNEALGAGLFRHDWFEMTGSQ